jgi:hypothetical protein
MADTIVEIDMQRVVIDMLPDIHILKLEAVQDT